MRRLLTKFPQNFQKFALLFLFIFAVYTAFSIAINLLYAMVLISYGAKAMPLMVFFLGVTQFISIILFSLRKNVVKKTAVLNTSLIILIITFVFTYAIAIPFGLPFFFVIAFIALQALMGIIIPQFDMVIANLFSVAEFKTIYPKISSAYSISSIVGGILLAILSSLYGTSIPLLVVIILFCLSLVLSLIIYKLYRTSLHNKKDSLATDFKRAFIDHEVEENIFSHSRWTIKSISSSFRDIRDSLTSLIREKILFQIIAFTLIAFIAYRFFSFIFDSFVNMNLSENEITPFFALLDVTLSIGSLIYRLFFSARLIKYISFTKAYLLQSTSMVIGITSMTILFFLGQSTWLYLYAGILYIIFQITIINRETSENIAFSLIPRIHRDQARTLTNSVGDAFSHIIASLFVIFIIHLFSLEYIILFGLLGTYVYFGLSFLFPKSVYASIPPLLKKSSHQDLHDVIEVIGERKGKIFLEPLCKLYPTSSTETKEKILLSLGEFKTSQAYDFLLQQFFQEGREIRLTLIQALSFYKKNHAFLLMYLIYTKAPSDVLEKAITYFLRCNKKKIIALISKDFLRSNDDEIKIIALRFLQKYKRTSESSLIYEYTQEHQSIPLITKALQTLYYTSRSHRTYVLERVANLFHATAKEKKISALYLIGTLGLKRLKKQVLLFIDNETDPEIRSKALHTLIHIDTKRAIHYFVYYMSSSDKQNNYLINEYIQLPHHFRSKIIDHIINLPVAAIESSIKYLLPHRHIVKQDIEMLYFSISQRFSSS